MSSGLSQSVLSTARRVACQASLTETSPPLLFLYPRWFVKDFGRNHSTERDHGRGGVNKILRPKTRTFRKIEDGMSGTDVDETTNVPIGRATSILNGNHGARALSRPLSSQSQGLYPRLSTGPKPVVQDMRPRPYFSRDLNMKEFVNLLSTVPAQYGNLESSKDTTILTTSLPSVRAYVYNIEIGNSWIHWSSGPCLVTIVSIDHELGTIELALDGEAANRRQAKQYIEHDIHGHFPREVTFEKCRPTTMTPEVFPSSIVTSPGEFLRRVKILVRMMTKGKLYKQRFVEVLGKEEDPIDALRKLFISPTSRSHVSLAALRICLKHCREYTHLAHLACTIWDVSEEQGIQPDIFCFNQELHRALLCKDVSRFIQLIDMIKLRNIKLDGESWGLMLLFTNSRLQREKIINIIRERNPTTISNLEPLVLAWIGREFEQFIRPDGIQAMLRLGEKLFGEGWLTTAVVRRLTRACVDHQVRSKVVAEMLGDLVSKQQNAKWYFDAGSYINLLHIASKEGDTQFAVEILQSGPFKEIFDEAQSFARPVLRRLWILAVKHKLPNLCHLVWHQSAALGCIDYLMREWVRAGLLAVDPDRDNVTKSTDFQRAMSLALSGTSKALASRTGKEKAVDFVLDHSRNAWKSHKPLPWAEFSAKLTKALNLDENLKDGQSNTDMTYGELGQHIISFDLPSGASSYGNHHPQLASRATNEESCTDQDQSAKFNQLSAFGQNLQTSKDQHIIPEVETPKSGVRNHTNDAGLTQEAETSVHNPVITHEYSPPKSLSKPDLTQEANNNFLGGTYPEPSIQEVKFRSVSHDRQPRPRRVPTVTIRSTSSLEHSNDSCDQGRAYAFA